MPLLISFSTRVGVTPCKEVIKLSKSLFLTNMFSSVSYKDNVLLIYSLLSSIDQKSTCELFLVNSCQLGQCFVNVGLIFKVGFKKSRSIALQVKTIEFCKVLVYTATGLASLTSCRFHSVTSDKQGKRRVFPEKRVYWFNKRSRKLKHTT